MRALTAAWILGLSSVAVAADAQTPAPPMAGMPHTMPMTAPTPASPPAATSGSTEGYKAAMNKMDRDMAMSYSGNADQDFVAGMLPHHQGAVDMARVELAYGKDPAIRRLARQVIAAQEKEIAFMKSWQARHSTP
jgi:uncharacterized protein (DUF305 family)